MRIPLTKYGLPQVAVLPAIVLAAMIVCLAIGISYLPAWAVLSAEAILTAVLIWVLAFFRDPYRLSPLDNKTLLAPADGKVTDIETVEENNFINGPAIKIAIFLSIFNTHINRAPCNVKVENISYRKGRFKDARNPLAGKVNESNDLYITRSDHPRDRLIVRQISGAVARRIVCDANQGQHLASGEKFGMIKFGSRTELYLPANGDAKLLVQVGDKVKAGQTVLVKYEMQITNNQ